MSFSQELREAVDADWTAAVHHRFVDGLFADSLPPETLRRYFVQDYQFIDRFVALLGAAVACADGYPARAVLARQLGVVAGDESTYFERVFDALDVPEQDRVSPELDGTTSEFNALMDSARVSGEYAYCLAVLAVAEWLYLDWAQRAPAQTPESFISREWIELHRGKEFRTWVDWLRGELDRVGPSLDPAARERCHEFFRLATELELDFFEAAYG